MTELLGLFIQIKTYGPIIVLVFLAQRHIAMEGKLDKLSKAFNVTLTAKQRKRLENLNLL